MQVRFTLDMESMVVGGKLIDRCTIVWEEEMSLDEIEKLSEKWHCSRKLLTSRMDDLSEVGKSYLTIEPVDETIDTEIPT